MAEGKRFNVKAVNSKLPFEVFKLYCLEAGFSALPLTGNTVPIPFKEYTQRLPSLTEIEHLIEKYKDADGVALITGYRGLLAFEIDGKQGKEYFWAKFKEVFGDYPEKLTWVERRIDPRYVSEHYHVYLVYTDYIHTVPCNGVRKLISFEDGEIALVYNTWIRATPSFHEGSKYQWIHDDKVLEPLKVSKKDFLRFVTLFDPYFELEARKKDVRDENNFEDRVRIDKLDKDLTDQQIDQIIEYIADSNLYPTPGQGRGLFVLGLSGLLAFVGVKEDSAKRLVERMFEELDPDKLESDKRRFLTLVESTYKRVRSEREISFKSWFRALGWTEDQIQEFKREIIKIIKPKPEEFIRKEYGYLIHIKNDVKKEKVRIEDEEGKREEIVTYYIDKCKIVKPSKQGIFWIYTVEEVKVTPEDAEILKQAGLLSEDFNINPNSKLITISTRRKSADRVTSDRVKIEKVVYFKDVYVKIRVRDELFEGRVETVVQELVDKGIVSKKYSEYFTQYLTWMAEAVPSDRVYDCVGVFANGNNLVCAIPTNVEVYPIDYFAQRIYYNALLSSQVDYQQYRQFLEAIRNYEYFLPEDVYYIVFGFMAISPFFHALLPITHFKPILLIVGGKGSGKTTLARFITKTAFGSEELRQDVFDSAFRQGIVLSSTTLPLLIDDVDKWSAHSIGRLKASLTGTQLMIRGKPSGAIQIFVEKASFVLTANTNVFDEMGDPAFLDRVIIVELQRNLSTKEKIDFAKRMRKIMSGYPFVSKFLSDLVEIVNFIGGIKKLEQIFEEYRTKAYEHAILDGRDPEKFALIMLGLKLLNAVLVKNDVAGIDLDKAEMVVVKYFKDKEIKESYPSELVNLAVKLFEINEIAERYSKEDKEEREMEIREKYDIYKYDEGLVITPKTIAVLRTEFPNVALPSNLKEVENLIKNVFEDLRSSKLYKFRRINGNIRRTLEIPFKVINQILGIVEPSEVEITTTDEDEERKDDDKQEKCDTKVEELDEIDKEIVDTANYYMEVIPNQNYQVDMFVKDIKNKFGDKIDCVVERIEKLLKRGLLQSHFVNAIEILQKELKQDSNKLEKIEEKGKQVVKEETKDGESEIRKEETKGKEEEREEKGEEESVSKEESEGESESKGESEGEEEEIEDIYKTADEVKKYKSYEELLKDLLEFVDNLEYRVDPENW